MTINRLRLVSIGADKLTWGDRIFDNYLRALSIFESPFFNKNLVIK